jgi:hypothetical protein
VLSATIAEMDYPLTEPVAEVLRAAIARVPALLRRAAAGRSEADGDRCAERRRV